MSTTTWGRIAPAAVPAGLARTLSVAGATVAAVAVWAVAALLVPALRHSYAGQGTS
ncbi:MAG TPA: hypothetical protein VJ371_16120 [Streptosporangiaceae bacterium]|jgi:hypothetical protein|nr:hypothetical protein [Streptosporangiaceae bacterium]